MIWSKSSTFLTLQVPQSGWGLIDTDCLQINLDICRMGGGTEHMKQRWDEPMAAPLWHQNNLFKKRTTTSLLLNFCPLLSTNLKTLGSFISPLLLFYIY